MLCQRTCLGAVHGLSIAAPASCFSASSADFSWGACSNPGFVHRPEASHLRPWDGKSPASVAGAVIYAICSLPTAAKHCSAADIAQVLQTSFLASTYSKSIAHTDRKCTFARHPSQISRLQRTSNLSRVMVVQVAAVAEGTVRSTYKDMYVYMAELVPSWFASQKELHQLPNAS